MADTEELKKIKKLYGERFMHLCRQLFPTILETEGKLLEILSQTFSTNSQTLYEDITSNNLEEKFKSYIYEKLSDKEPEEEII